MIKKLLLLTLGAVAVSGAYPLGPKRMLPQGDNFKVSTDRLKAPKKTQTRSDEAALSLDFTLAYDVYSATMLSGVNVGDEIYEAFRMPESAVSTFSGNSVTAVNITTGAVVIGQNGYPNQLTDVTVFISEDLNGAPVYTQAGKLGTGILTEYSVKLDTPYEIKEGTPFYVGYYFTLANENQAYLVFDGVSPDYEATCLVGVKEDGEVSWADYGTQIGSLCIGCTISGDNLPQNGVDLVDYGGQYYTEPGKEFEYQFLIRSTGAVTDNVEFTYTVGESGPLTKTVTLDEPLGYNNYAIISLPGMVCNEERLDVPMTFSITKVNGAENTAAINQLSATINCYDPSKGYPRVHLIEEGTGTWCGYCPLGMLMMEYITEKYPDFFARVAIHGNGVVRDPMAVSSTSAWINVYADGFPCALIDRSVSVDAIQMGNMTVMQNEIDEYVKDNKTVPSFAEMQDVTCGYDEKGKLTVDGKVKFAFDIDNSKRLRMSYYITQDNVGPYDQTNYYSGGTRPMGGWESKGEEVETMYDDVCRLLVGGARGVVASLPEDIVAGEVYGYSANISVDAVTSDQYNLIIFIVDNFTGEIVNAKQLSLEKPDNSGVEEIDDDADVLTRKYYSISGVEVDTPSDGIFIVRTVYADGSVKTAKIVF